MNKQFTLEEIAENLQNRQSCELYEETVTYYLHVNANGELTDGYSTADATFTADVLIHTIGEELGINVDQEETPDFIYNAEDMKYEHFRGIVENLTKQVNIWLFEQSDTDNE